MASCERPSNLTPDAHWDMVAVTVCVAGGLTGAVVVAIETFSSLLLETLEWQKCHEIGVVHDVGLGGAPDQFTFGGVGRDDMAHRVRNTALYRQRHAGKRVPQHLATPARLSLAIYLLVFEQLANVCKNRTRDDGIEVDRQCVAHKFGHALGGFAGDVHNAALV